METYQYYIDDIQSAVYSEATADPDFLRDSAAQYAEACAEVNDRLRQVGRLLHRGLRSEALQLAEEEPNLLDTVAMLDFPELPKWSAMLSGWGMATPPPLLIDLAADINRAYAEQQPLETLLKQHRLLALARAPLPARIQTLRRIRRLDAGNVAWEADLTSFEQARLKEISVAAESAARHENLATLASMAREFDGDGWTIDVPSGLAARVRSLHQDLAAKVARRELEDIAAELNAAHMALEADAGRRAFAKWTATARTARLEPEDPLRERVAPALEWLAKEERLEEEGTRRAEAIAALELALDDDAPANELERCLQAASNYEDPIPPVLENRTRQRLDALAIGTRRRQQILITAIVASVFVVGAIVAFVIVQQVQRRAVTASAGTLGTLIDQGQLEEAERYYTELASSSPRVAASAEVRKHKARLDDTRKAEKDRQKMFGMHMRRAEQAGPESPDRAALAEARRVARLPAEKERMLKFESKIAELQRREQTKQDDELAGRISGFRGRLQQLEGASTSEMQALQTGLTQLRREIHSSKNELASASRPLVAQLEPLLARIEALERTLQARMVERRGRAAITAAVGDVAAYREALDTFAAQNSESRLAGNLARLREEGHLWEGLIRWNALLAADPLQSTNYISAKRASGYLAEGRQLQAEFGDIPLGSTFKAKEAYLESVALRKNQDGKSAVSQLKQLMRDPLIGSLWMVEKKDGPRYYCRQKPAGERIKYISGLDLSQKETIVPQSDTALSGPAPQSVAAKECLELLGTIESKGWEPTFTGIAQVLAADNHIDPLLKIALLERVLDLALPGSTILTKSFDAYKEALNSTRVDVSVNWLDPRDKAANAERDRASILLGSLPDLEAAISSTLAEYAEQRHGSPDDYQWLGWLGRDARGNWQVVRPKSANAGGDVVVIHKHAGDSDATISVIGQATADGLELSPRHQDLFVEGRPVFLRRQSGSK